MKKLIVCFVLILTIILFLIIFLMTIEKINLDKKSKENYEVTADETANEEIKGTSEKSEDSEVSRIDSESKTGSKTGGGVGVSEDNEFKQLPKDIETAECGVYFEEYGACKGTCPSGNCEQEGRSCYCKEQ